jgi:homoserine O-acetyltransferase/O-succinyltransferase
LEWATQTGRHALGTLSLQSGASLPGAEPSWKTYGALTPARDNVIVYPTSYTAHHTDLENLIGPDGVLDPTRWFIVIPNMFANGLSSSPSNNDKYPSLVTTTDNVRAQQRFLREAFKIDRIACV